MLHSQRVCIRYLPGFRSMVADQMVSSPWVLKFRIPRCGSCNSVVPLTETTYDSPSFSTPPAVSIFLYLAAVVAQRRTAVLDRAYTIIPAGFPLEEIQILRARGRPEQAGGANLNLMIESDHDFVPPNFVCGPFGEAAPFSIRFDSPGGRNRHPSGPPPQVLISQPLSLTPVIRHSYRSPWRVDAEPTRQCGR
jgi:hypothetical protein